MTDTAERTHRQLAVDAIVERTAALRRELESQHTSVRIQVPPRAPDADRTVAPPLALVPEPLPAPDVPAYVPVTTQSLWRIPLEVVLPIIGMVMLLVAVLIWIG